MKNQKKSKHLILKLILWFFVLWPIFSIMFYNYIPFQLTYISYRLIPIAIIAYIIVTIVEDKDTNYINKFSNSKKIISISKKTDEINLSSLWGSRITGAIIATVIIFVLSANNSGGFSGLGEVLLLYMMAPAIILFGGVVAGRIYIGLRSKDSHSDLKYKSSKSKSSKKISQLEKEKIQDDLLIDKMLGRAFSNKKRKKKKQ